MTLTLPVDEHRPTGLRLEAQGRTPGSVSHVHGSRRPYGFTLGNLLGHHEAHTQRVLDEIRAVMDPQLLHDVGAVDFDGLDREHEKIRDVLVRLALCHQLQHLALALRQAADAIGRCELLAVALRQDAGDGRREVPFSAHGGVEVHFGKHHEVDSSEAAFKTAGSIAFRNVFREAKPCLLEPMVKIHITVPREKLGDINSDLPTRRGRVLGTDSAGGNMMTVTAEAPLAEVTTYARSLSSMTGGQGSYTMEFSHYDVVPAHVQKSIMEKAVMHEEEEA